MTNEQITKIKDVYKEVFSREPSETAKLPTILKRLEKEGIDISQFSDGADEVSQPKTVEAKVEVIEESDPREKLALVQGRGSMTQYLVIFKGQPRYWTKATIQSMKSSFEKDIKFPEGSPFEGVHSFETCKSC